jgi:hypothetical protein
MQRSSIRRVVWDTYCVKLAKFALNDDLDTCHSSTDGRSVAVRAGSRVVMADWKESDDWIRGMKSAVDMTRLRLAFTLKLHSDENNESRFQENLSST